MRRFEEDPIEELRRYRKYLVLNYGRNFEIEDLTKDEQRQLRRLQSKASAKV
jgi:hypothetical protein